MADCFHDCERRSPTRVLATAIYCTLEKKYFDERTPRAEIATMFCVTTTQLTKAVTGVDYKSGPHSSMKKRKTTDAAQTTPSKVAKTTADSTPFTSKTGNPAINNAPAPAKPSQSKKGHEVTESLRNIQGYNKTIPTDSATQQYDTLSSSSDSDSLPEVPFK